MLDGYCKAIQSDLPIKLEILATKSLADGFQELNEDRAFHSHPSDLKSESNHLTSTFAVAAPLTELCNPAFEHDLTETGASNMTGLLHKRYTEGTMQKSETAFSSQAK